MLANKYNSFWLILFCDKSNDVSNLSVNMSVYIVYAIIVKHKYLSFISRYCFCFYYCFLWAVRLIKMRC